MKIKSDNKIVSSSWVGTDTYSYIFYENMILKEKMCSVNVKELNLISICCFWVFGETVFWRKWAFTGRIIPTYTIKISFRHNHHYSYQRADSCYKDRFTLFPRWFAISIVLKNVIRELYRSMDKVINRTFL